MADIKPSEELNNYVFDKLHPFVRAALEMLTDEAGETHSDHDNIAPLVQAFVIGLVRQAGSYAEGLPPIDAEVFAAEMLEREFDEGRAIERKQDIKGGN